MFKSINERDFNFEYQYFIIDNDKLIDIMSVIINQICLIELLNRSILQKFVMIDQYANLGKFMRTCAPFPASC